MMRATTYRENDTWRLAGNVTSLSRAVNISLTAETFLS